MAQSVLNEKQVRQEVLENHKGRLIVYAVVHDGTEVGKGASSYNWGAFFVAS